MKKLMYIFLVICIYMVGANYSKAENFVKVGYNQSVTVYVDTDSIQVVRNDPPYYMIRYREMLRIINKIPWISGNKKCIMMKVMMRQSLLNIVQLEGLLLI